MQSIKIYDSVKLQQKTFVVVSRIFSNIQLYDRLSLLNGKGEYQGYRTVVNIEQIKLRDIDQKTTFLDKDCIKETYLDIMQNCYNFKLDEIVNVLTLSSYTSPQNILDNVQQINLKRTNNY